MNLRFSSLLDFRNGIIFERMQKQFTIYFDTSFYVNLCRADEDAAIQTIESINALNVRHVLSDIIIRELITSRDRAEQDKTLVRRVGLFSLSPYCTRNDLDWKVLLLSGQGRVGIADLFRGLDEMMTVANSFSIMANRQTNEDQAAKLSAAGRPLLEPYGFPEDSEKNPNQAMKAARNMLETFVEQFGLVGLDLPDILTKENMGNLSEQIKSLLGPDLVARLERDGRLKDSSTKTEDRPYQVAARIATHKTKKRLGNTLRDTDHITVFVDNHGEIDFLHVDSVHEKIIKRPSPIHHLTELGLADRCFSANSLGEIVVKVRELIAARSSIASAKRE